jgi:hypothetical protein
MFGLRAVCSTKRVPDCIGHDCGGGVVRVVFAEELRKQFFFWKKRTLLSGLLVTIS